MPYGRPELDDESRRLLAIFEACLIDELDASDLISHPQLFAAQRGLEDEVRALRLKCASALFAFREHCKKIAQ
jgi:hypothetical protein